MPELRTNDSPLDENVLISDDFTIQDLETRPSLVALRADDSEELTFFVHQDWTLKDFATFIYGLVEQNPLYREILCQIVDEIKSPEIVGSHII